jgi:hypothetical protein
MQARAGSDQPEASRPMQSFGGQTDLVANARRREHVLDRGGL